MNILVLNVGSSSLKYGLIDSVTGLARCQGIVEHSGPGGGRESHRWRGSDGLEHQREGGLGAIHQGAALDIVQRHLDTLARQGNLPTIAAIGHRVVHGGEAFAGPVLLDAQVLTALPQLNPLAPLHNPPALAVIGACRARYPALPQVAVFDTAFHHSLPPRAYRYGVPDPWYVEHRVRRYGFHGISHRHVAGRAADHLARPPRSLKLITLHLGNGASAAAIDGGLCIDTSMGMTPLEGLLMGARSGDLDVAAALYAGRKLGLTMAELERQLTRDSGVKGLCGTSDMRQVIERSQGGDEAAELALDIYCYRIRKYIGAYSAALGGLDALVFTAGIGENAPEVRALACAGLEFLGVRIDPARNAAARGETGGEISNIHGDGSGVSVLVIPTNEELEIARQVGALLAEVAGSLG